MSKVIHGDCLEVMPTLPDKSIDMILCDLPYGTTACKWDSIIPFEPLWLQYKRLIKDNGAIVLTARQPFTSALIMGNVEMFRQTWVWDKVISVNFMNCYKQHTQGFEDVCVFYKKTPIYNPQMEKGKPFKDNRQTEERWKTEALGSRWKYVHQNNSGTRFPRGIIKFTARNNKPLHPTQKPVSLFEYLIRTYTNENETVLDNCAGSGTTAIACLNTNRNYILIEQEQIYIDIINKRIAEHEQQLSII